MTKHRAWPKPAWNFTDVIIVLGLTVALPVLFIVILIFLGRFGILPRSVGLFLVSESMAANAVRYLIALAIESALLRQVLRHYHLKWSAFGWQRPPLWRSLLTIIGMYLLFGLLVLVVFTVVAVLFPVVNLNETQTSVLEFGRNGIGLWLSFIASVVIAPIIEETQFRGFVLPAFSAAFGSTAGIILSALVFAILHFQLNVVIYTFVLGILLALMYRRLGSIVPGIVLHMLNNALAFLALIGILR